MRYMGCCLPFNPELSHQLANAFQAIVIISTTTAIASHRYILFERKILRVLICGLTGSFDRRECSFPVLHIVSLFEKCVGPRYDYLRVVLLVQALSPHLWATPMVLSFSRWTTEGGDDDEVDEEELEAMLEGTKDDSDEDEQVTDEQLTLDSLKVRLISTMVESSIIHAYNVRTS